MSAARASDSAVSEAAAAQSRFREAILPKQAAPIRQPHRGRILGNTRNHRKVFLLWPPAGFFGLAPANARKACG